MKRLYILGTAFLIVVLILMGMIAFGQTTTFVRCKEITKAGKQCTRKVVIDGYCTQHYRLKTSKPIPSKPNVDLPEEWPAISTNSSKQDVMTAWRDPATNVIHLSFKH